ncbi:MAG: hypothetical protein DIU60_013835 [Actinomycetes bacterium]|jgi:hypothetical protein|nr:MAG: hypothetical protein DIU60_15450 [Actinomycetota bacterium]
MAVRPTEKWRGDAEVLWRRPEPLLELIDEALAAFEGEVAGLGEEPDDEKVFDVIRRVVVELNILDQEHGAAFDEVDRVELCAYIEQVLTEHGIDVPALAERRGIKPSEITDEWREW